MDKKSIRKEYLKKRKMLTKEQCEQMSELIINTFLKSNWYIENNNIGIYMDYNNEVITENLIRRCLKDGKRVFIPKIESNEMYFTEINDSSKILNNCYGIKENVDDDIVKYYNLKNMIFLVPGVVFSKNKKRIGYGGGYYDRWISKNKDNIYIGLAYDIQIVDDFEIDINDRLVDFVITNKDII